MTDKELLELAAKAAGIDDAVFWSAIHETCFWTDKYDSGTAYQKDAEWNPIKDDGDALRLAVKLHLGNIYDDTFINVFRCGHGKIIDLIERYGDDSNAATRRAIVRAAAETGKAMP